MRAMKQEALEQNELSLPHYLQGLRGKIRAKSVLAKRCWFQVGGEAEWLFAPEDTEDLIRFQQQAAKQAPVFVLGVGSNLLVRDGGIDGVVVRLGRGFTGINPLPGNRIEAGAAALDANVAMVAREQGIAGLEFLVGIPGTIGGALAMNAGAYGKEMKDVLVEAEYVDVVGALHIVTAQDLQMMYRHSEFPKGAIFTRAVLQGAPGNKDEISSRMQQISTEREKTQPVNTRTGGSTFKNPPGAKAWQVVDAAGCRGFVVGDAQVSELHCNFLINRGNASAHDIELLGEQVRKRVQETQGVSLEWEIARVGKFRAGEEIK